MFSQSIKHSEYEIYLISFIVNFLPQRDAFLIFDFFLVPVHPGWNFNCNLFAHDERFFSPPRHKDSEKIILSEDFALCHGTLVAIHSGM